MGNARVRARAPAHAGAHESFNLLLSTIFQRCPPGMLCRLMSSADAAAQSSLARSYRAAECARRFRSLERTPGTAARLHNTNAMGRVVEPLRAERSSLRPSDDEVVESFNNRPPGAQGAGPPSCGSWTRPSRTASPPTIAAAILATASLPRRTGRGMESDEAAEHRGAVDKAIAGLLFQGGLRRSESCRVDVGRRAGRQRRARDPGTGAPLQDRPGRDRGRRSVPQRTAPRRRAAASSATVSPSWPPGCALPTMRRCSVASTASP